MRPRTLCLHRSRSILSLAFAAILLAGSAGRAADVAPTDGPVPDANLVAGSLPNGVRFAILPNREPRNRVSLRLLILAGSLHETDRQQGLAHFLEHMAFNGSTHFPPGSLVAFFQKLGMAFGADINASTGFEQTIYQIELPNGSEEFMRESLLVLRDYCDRLLLLPEEVDRERGVILSEMRSRDSIGFRTARRHYRFLFPDAILADRFPIGTEEIVQAASRQDLYDYFSQWYRPERTAVIIVGDVEPAAAQALVAEIFSDFKAKTDPVEPPDRGRVAATGLRFGTHREPEASEVRISIHAQRTYVPQTDTLEERRRDLVNASVMRMLSLRLQTLARQAGAPFLEGGAYAEHLFRFASLSTLAMRTKPDRWEAALETAERELRRALEYGFSRHEVEAIRADSLRQAREAVSRAPARQSPQLAMQVLRSIADERIFTHPSTDLAWIEAAWNELTAESAHQAFRQLWEDAGWTVFVTGPLGPDVDENRVEEVWSRSKDTLVTATEEQADLAFAYTDFGPAGIVAAREEVPDLGIVHLRFANGVRVNLKQTDFSPGSLLFGLRVGHGRLAEPEARPGLALLAEAYFNEAGLGKHSHDDLTLMLAGRSVHRGMSIESDAILFSGTTQADQLDLQLTLLAAAVSDPGRCQSVLDRIRLRLYEEDAEAKRTPSGVLQNAVQQALAGGDGRFGRPEPDVLASYSLDDIHDWMEPMLKEGYLELALVGEFEVDAAVDAVARTLGALPRRAETKDPLVARRILHRMPGPIQRVFPVHSRIPNAMSVVYWPGPDMWDIARTRRMQLLGRVFSDRLRVKVRETMGETYSPGAGFQASDTYRDYGWIIALVTVDPDRAEQIAEVMDALAADLAKNPLDPEEVDRARLPLLTSLRDTVRSNSYWLNSVLISSQEYPQRVQWARTMQKDIESITVSELEELARQYLRPEERIRVLILPQATED